MIKMRPANFARKPMERKPLKSGGRKRRLEDKLRQPGKVYSYYGQNVERHMFVDHLVKEGYNRAHVELALKILESTAGVRRITDMDVVNFIKTKIMKSPS